MQWIGDVEAFRESCRLKWFCPQNGGTVTEYSCSATGKENQFYNPDPLLYWGAYATVDFVARIMFFVGR